MVAEQHALHVVEGAAAPAEGPFLSVGEAAAILGVSTRRLYDLLKVRDGESKRPLIPHERAGEQGDAYVLHRAEIVRYAREGRPHPWADPPPVDRPLPEDRVAEVVIGRLVRALAALQRDGGAAQW